ncbi:MAG: DeoR/GlpR family DNA-binding transcription regulator [Parvibaculaceae bacterium]
MRASKRHSEILRILSLEGTASIASLAERFSVSLETIRRDIAPLVDRGEAVKHHGAVSLSQHASEAPFERRMRENAVEKRAIATAVAEAVEDGDSLMLDTGTTTSVLARALLSKRNLTVVTNSSDIARTLSTVNGNTVFMAGGQLHGDNGAAFGSSSIDFVSKFKVRHAIITIAALDAEAGPTDYILAEAEFARTVLACGERRLIVTDHSKFGRRALIKVCDFGDFDTLVTDRAPPADLAAMLSQAGVETVVAAL